MSASPAVAELSITFDAEATIFDAGHSIIRYDLPARGIVQGWTIAAVLEQAQALAGERWPEIPIVINADDEVEAAFTRIVEQQGGLIQSSAQPAAEYAPTDDSNEGVETSEEVERDEKEPAFTAPDNAGEKADLASVSDSARSEDEFKTVRRTRAQSSKSGAGPTRRGGLGSSWFSISPIHGLVALAVVACGLSCWWVVENYALSANDDAQASASVIPSTPSTSLTPTSPTNPTNPTTATDKPSPPAVARVVHDHAGMRIVTPRGFSVSDSKQPGVYSANGPDPDLRVYFTFDALNDDQPDEIRVDNVLNSVLDTVAHSPDLSDGHQEAGADPSERRQVRYLEKPGDGSEIAWTTWVDGAYQLTVGCHGRQGVKPEHQQACSQVVDSAEVLEESAGVNIRQKTLPTTEPPSA